MSNSTVAEASTEMVPASVNTLLPGRRCARSSASTRPIMSPSGSPHRSPLFSVRRLAELSRTISGRSR